MPPAVYARREAAVTTLLKARALILDALARAPAEAGTCRAAERRAEVARYDRALARLGHTN